MKILLGIVLLVVMRSGAEQFPAQKFNQEPGVSHFGLYVSKRAGPGWPPGKDWPRGNVSPKRPTELTMIPMTCGLPYLIGHPFKNWQTNKVNTLNSRFQNSKRFMFRKVFGIGFSKSSIPTLNILRLLIRSRRIME